MTPEKYAERVYWYLQMEYPTAVELLASMDCPLLVNVQLTHLVNDRHASGDSIQSAAYFAADYVDWAKKNEPSWNKGAK
jgi:hypothetical protein